MITLADLQKKIRNNKIVTSINEENLKYFNAVAPMSAPSFHEQFYYYNNFYHTVLQVASTGTEMNEYVLQGLIEGDNISVTIDEEYIATDSIKDFLGSYIDNVDKDLSIMNKFNNIRKTQEEMRENSDFLYYLADTNEQTRLCTIRIFIKEKTKKDLENIVNTVSSFLKGIDISASIQTNDLISDVKSILKFDNPVRNIMPSRAIADILMHENASIVEPNVSMLGHTKNGVYAPDFSSYKNKSFCVALLGVQGSGKSSVMKRMLEDDILSGNNVMILDMHANEYGGLSYRYNIPTISFNENLYINGFELFSTIDGNGVITDKDIGIVVSLMSEIYKLQSGITDNTVISLYSEHLMDLYQPYNNKNISDFRHEHWFISTDILDYVTQKEENDEYQEEEKDYILIMKVGIRKMMKTYGYLFNHHTNIDIDLTKSSRFDLSFLEELKDENVVTAYLTLIMSYIRKACMINEKYNNEAETGKDKTKLERPKRTLRIAFEEFGTSAKHTVFLNEVDTLMRLTRKCRVGFLFALHTTRDIDISDKKRSSLIESIFGLCATYIVGQIDEKTAQTLPYFISAITENDTKIAKKFTKNEVTKERDFIAITDKGQKIKFTSMVSPTQQEYFRGGV